ncbi:MAG: sugar ABC transporter permease [Chloroflexi bacterium]|jgi:multiple sugar transport system permease protein|nr:sugar ABC transporter permease [Chloroflexota bacterium]MDL1885208.1 sugar ABC transporter permease [Anaerolineae bacterium CFX8]
MWNVFLNQFGRTPLTRRKALWGMALVAPNVLGLMFFFGIPVLMAFATSLQQWNAIKPPVFVGLDNFTRLAGDAAFWQALGNTAKLLLLTVPVEIFLALNVAIMLNQRLRGRGFFRTLYFLPVVTSTVAAAIVWTWIFQPRYGLVGNLLAPLGLRDQPWLTRPDLVLFPIAAVTVWQRLGFDMVLFLAGLQAIPRVLYEAAIIDGARGWQRFRFITLPLLSPTTFLVIVLSVISGFQIFDQVYIMTARTTRGGVGGSATTLSYFLYQSAFVQSEFGYASAIALVLFLITLGVTAFQLSIQRRWVYYEAGER